MRRSGILLFLLLLALPVQAENRPVPAPKHWLVLGSVDLHGRRPFRPDTVFARYLLDRSSPPPKAGDELTGESGKKQAWRAVDAGKDGAVGGEDFSWAYAPMESDAARVVLATLEGAGILYVNGTAYVGDLYGKHRCAVPVPLRKGENHLFVTYTRGQFRLSFDEAEGTLRISSRDVTRPDFVAGRPQSLPVAVVVENTSRKTLSGIRLVCAGSPGFAVTRSAPFSLPPLALRKVGVFILPAAKGPWPAKSGTIHFALGALSEDAGAATALSIAVRAPGAVRRRTFISAIDGSVQEYAVLPPSGEPKDAGLVLSLHGAGVDEYNQARSYSQKPDFWIVAATNRRPFGFDWQDWGRENAYATLADALSFTHVDRRKVYLTGHSMGGHGVWHLAANDPDGFAAIAPSAGWASFSSYVGTVGDKSPWAPLWRSADAASDTLSLVGNLAQFPIFVVHGTKDDNVPISEAKRMISLLEKAGAKPEHHFQEGAGHWWNGKVAKGVDCVDWPGIFDLFRKHEIAKAPESIRFTSVDPSVDSVHYWIRVIQPVVYGKPLQIKADYDEKAESLSIETKNVYRFMMNPPFEVKALLLDGEPHLVGHGYVRQEGRWAHDEVGASAGEKRPERSGPFKRAFDNRFVFVYGTGGDEAARRETFERARYDSEVWWYRGNGGAALVADGTFDAPTHPGNVILYGNADTNAAWSQVLPGSCPVKVTSSSIQVGGKTYAGKDLACLFVYPRKGNDSALVGVFGATGPSAMRLGYLLSTFSSGVGYPDYVVFSKDLCTKGDGAVLAAGYFNRDWQLGAEEKGGKKRVERSEK